MNQVESTDLELIGGILLSINIIVQILHRNNAIDKHEIINALDFVIGQINEIKPGNKLTTTMDMLKKHLSVEFPNLFSPPSSKSDEMKRVLLQVIEGGLQSKNKCSK